MKGMFWRALTLTATIFAISCAGALASEYYDVGQNYAVYLAWTEDGAGHLQGQVEVVSMDSSNTRLQTKNAAFTGARNGSDVSLTFGQLTAFGGTTWTGNIGWLRLNLMIPTDSGEQRVALHPGSFDQFHAAVSRMQANLAVNQSHVATYNAMSEAADHVKNGYNSMNTGLASLRALLPVDVRPGSLRSKYAEEWQKMQVVWRKEQEEAHVTPMTCDQKRQVEYQSGQVDYELGQFQYLDGQVHYLQSQYADAFHEVAQGIGDIQNWGPAYNARARDYYASIGGSYNHNVVAMFTPQILSAQKSLKVFTSRWQAFEAYAHAYGQRAKQQDEQAKAFAQSITCSDN